MKRKPYIFYQLVSMIIDQFCIISTFITGPSFWLTLATSVYSCHSSWAVASGLLLYPFLAILIPNSMYDFIGLTTSTPQVVPYANPGITTHFHWSFTKGSKSFQTFNLVSCGFSPLAAHGLITFPPLVALFYNPVRKQMLWLLPQWTLPVSWHFLAAFGCNFQLSKAQF